MSTRGISIPIELSISVSGRIGRGGNNTGEEDSPNGVMPALSYRSRNVLPTDVGYHSAFQPMPIKRNMQSRPHDYKVLGDKWKTMHSLARWGGDFRRADGGHFSLEHNGVK